MNEKEKYLDMMKKFKEKYPSYIEIKTNEIERNIFNVGETILCINNNFVITDPTHGLKEGLTFGKIYQIESIPWFGPRRAQN